MKPLVGSASVGVLEKIHFTRWNLDQITPTRMFGIIPEILPRFAETPSPDRCFILNTPVEAPFLSLFLFQGLPLSARPARQREDDGRATKV